MDNLTRLIDISSNADRSPSAYPFDLGTYGRSASTSSIDAQVWFDRGLVWCYAFNHEEAIGCFERAIAADDRFALAHWGLAYAAGPNYNKQWDAFDDVDLRASLGRAYAAVQRAAELAEAAPPVERDLIGALAERYPSPRTGDGSRRLDGRLMPRRCARCTRKHPDDLDAAALFADALLNVTAWSLWDLPSGRPAEGAHTLEAKRVLESALTAAGRDGPSRAACISTST